MADNKTKIFGIGVSGLVGSRIVEILQDKYTIDNLSLDTGVDITNPQTLDIISKDTTHPIVLHLAAKTDIEGCEKDKPLGEQGDTYKINVLGTQNIVNACKQSNKKIIYISTDYVFDGENPPEGGYTEEDTPHPNNWYGESKYQGEEVVKNSGLPYLIIRIGFPYRKEFELKKDFVRVIRENLKNNQPISRIIDQKITPTFIDDIAIALDKLIETNAQGIYHVLGSQSLSPYEAARIIAQKFNYDPSIISKSTKAEVFKGKAPRPTDLTINNQKIKKLGVNMRTFEEGLEAIKQQ